MARIGWPPKNTGSTGPRSWSRRCAPTLVFDEQAEHPQPAEGSKSQAQWTAEDARCSAAFGLVKVMILASRAWSSARAELRSAERRGLFPAGRLSRTAARSTPSASGTAPVQPSTAS
jgi:hypothetical protein